MRPLRFLFWVLCFGPLLEPACASSADYQYQAESEYFDAHATDASTLLKNLYGESKLLLLGAANHRNMQHHLILIDLLKAIGTDPNLKYIVLEQSKENDDLYKLMSTEDVFAVLRTHKFKNDHERLLTLCWSREWSWVYTHLFPVIQEINRKRPTDNPLIVRGVDGFSLELPYGVLSPMPVNSGDCQFNNPPDQNTLDNIQNRETRTAGNFYTDIWSNLKDGQKAIVLYHQAHLYRYFKSCRIVRSESSAESRIAPRNWFSVLIEDHPEIADQSRLVIFDETDANHHPQGVLRFSQRQVDRHPGDAWAIDVRGMRGIDTERGQNAWIFSPVSYNNEGMNYSDKYFYEIVDGVIWSPRAELDHKVGEVTDYLGNLCPTGGYDGHSAIPPRDMRP